MYITLLVLALAFQDRGAHVMGFDQDKTVASFTSKLHEEGGSTSSRRMSTRSPRCTRSCVFRSPTTGRATRPP
jgi:hypothetical protein